MNYFFFQIPKGPKLIDLAGKILRNRPTDKRTTSMSHPPHFLSQIRTHNTLYNTQEQMEAIKHSLPTRQYSHITKAKRLRLLQLVLLKSHSICAAARHIGIALSTAKQIVKKYKSTGTYFVAKEERKHDQPFPYQQEVRDQTDELFPSIGQQNNTLNIQNHTIQGNTLTQVCWLLPSFYNMFWCPNGEIVIFVACPDWN